MKIRYTYVPPCPRCGSANTGRYIHQEITLWSFADAERKALDRGELVRVSSLPSSQMEANLFCADCGVEWMGSTRTLKLTRDEIDGIKTKKEITEADFAKFQKKKQKGLLSRIFLKDKGA